MPIVIVYFFSIFFMVCFVVTGDFRDLQWRSALRRTGVSPDGIGQLYRTLEGGPPAVALQGVRASHLAE